MSFIRDARAWRNRIRLAVYPSAILFVILFQGIGHFRAVAGVITLSSLLLFEIALVAQRYSHGMWSVLQLARHEHALFRAAAEGSQEPFYACKAVCDEFQRVKDFKLIYGNAAAAQLFGREHADLVGESASSILPVPLKLKIMGAWARVAATGVAETMQIPIALKNGGAAMSKARVVPLANGVAVTLLRSMEDEEIENRRQQLGDFAQSIIQSAPVSMIATDIHGTILAMNSAAERLTLYRRHDLVGEHSLVLLHDPQELSARSIQLTRQLEKPVSAGFDSLVATVREGEAEEREWHYIRKDGSRACVNLTMSVLRTADGRLTGYLGVAVDVSERQELVKSMVHMAQHDQLTGLPNRVLLNDRLEQGIERSRRSNKEVAVFMIDIDNFKRINDSLGHPVGDALLKVVAEQLQSSVRRSDTVARVGGDEFVVVMQEFRGEEDAERCAALMLQKIGMPQMIGGRELRVTASIGYCLYPRCSQTVEGLMQNADIAMYAAKTSGRARACAFSEEMAKEVASKLEIEEALRGALDRNEFELHYQPQIHCLSGEVIGMEGLLRWNSAELGNVSPARFIPVAEETGLLVPIGEWVVKQACFDCVEAQATLGRPLDVSVNVSPRQFNEKNLGGMIHSALKQSGLAAHHLEIEITEQMLMHNTPTIVATLEELRQLGVSVAIDDFGTGFSSLSYVMQYKVDRLKIDQGFIAKSLTDPGAASVVRTILAMAHSLRIDVVAEGVETIEQLNFLLRRKCDVAQGYLFSRAVPLPEFANAVHKIEAWVNDQRQFALQVTEARTKRVSNEANATRSWQPSLIGQV